MLKGHTPNCQCGVCKAIRGEHITEEIKRKISETLCKNPPFKGKHHTQDSKQKMRTLWKDKYKKGHKHPKLGYKTSNETKQKISKANKGKKRTVEQRKNISSSLKGKKQPTSVVKKRADKLRNKSRPKEVKEKISKTLQGHIVTEETRKKIRKKRAKQKFPIEDTSIEVKIQNFCKQLKIPYITHKYIDIEHSYLCDLFLLNYNTVIECDGDYWHSVPEVKERDGLRNNEMKEKAINVIRLPEYKINNLTIDEFEKIIMENCHNVSLDN